MKAEYSNSKRSRKQIRNAFISLLNQKSFMEISVSDIAKTAKINRGTFYNHYNNPNEILEEIKDELMQKFEEGLNNSNRKNNMGDLIEIAIDHFQKNEKDYRVIINAVPSSNIDKIKKEIIENISKLNLNIDLITIFFVVNGLSGLYIDYLKKNINFSYEQIKQLSKQILEKIEIYNFKK